MPAQGSALGHTPQNTPDGDAGSGDPAYSTASGPLVGRVPSRGGSPEGAKEGGGERGGPGKAHQLFGEQLPKLLDELNEVLAA